MNRYIQDIKEKTQGMKNGAKIGYVLTYYWYHILGIAAVVFLLIFCVVHFAFGTQNPEFTCVLVNQPIDYSKDQAFAKEFGKAAGLDADRVIIDSDYQISYGDVQLEGINESSYEKFFFKWSGGELDAVLLPESFLKYCQEMGGTFLDMKEFDTGTMELYYDGDSAVGLKAEETKLSQLTEGDLENMVLVFPSEGKNQVNSQKFIRFVGGECK